MPNFRYLSLLGLIAVALALYFAPLVNVSINHSPIFPERIPGTFTRKIVAIGDLHGDLANALKVLHMAGVTDEHGDWAGNIDYLVQTGDIVDR